MTEFHYEVLIPWQRDGYSRHEIGERAYRFDEIDAAKHAEFVADGTLVKREGLIPEVPPPPPLPPPPEPEPEPEPPLMLLEWVGEGEPPPGTWAYYRKYGRAYPVEGEPALARPDEPVIDTAGSSVVTEAVDLDAVNGVQARKKRGSSWQP